MTNTNKILIITNSSDIHADIMISLLMQKNVALFRLNLDEFPKKYNVSQHIEQNQYSAEIVNLDTNETLSSREIRSVWARKPADFSFISDDLSTQEQRYAEHEAEHTLYSILYALDCFWINHPLSNRAACWKGEQSIRAIQMGFNVPATLITNKPESVLAFKNNATNEIVLKSMSSPFLSANEVEFDELVVNGGLSTTIITDEHMENINSVREIPCYFQEYVNKQFELRVTVVGNKVFAAKINSQDDERTKIDFRDFSVDIAYEVFQLPDDIRQKCLDFVHSYNLEYGAIDLIVTPDNEYVFLENNPAGQFLFIQQLVPELLIMEAVLDCLMEGARC